MRRVRPWVIAAGCLLALAVAAALVARTQGELLRESAANYLRERLAAEFGAQFQTRRAARALVPAGALARARDVPPARRAVGADGRGRPALLQPLRDALRARAARAAGARAAASLRARGAGSPRGPGRGGGRRGAGPGRRRARAAIAARLAGFLLRPPFPLRMLEVFDGRAEVLERSGGRTVVEGVDLAVSSRAAAPRSTSSPGVSHRAGCGPRARARGCRGRR